MPLKIALKPRERLILGGAVVRNGNTGARLTVENEVPILREHDILSQRETTSPCRRIYFVIQLMYVDEANLDVHLRLYQELLRDILEAAPSTMKYTGEIERLVRERKYYQALKVARQLIDYEQELLKQTCHPTTRTQAPPK